LYDQRGSGRSRLDRLEETTLHVNRFLEDIEALRIHLRQARLTLVGHSWGANLALLYSASYPEHVERVVLIGLGPINDGMSAVAAANLRKPLSAEEREKLATLSAQRRAALETGDLQAHRNIHI